MKTRAAAICAVLFGAVMPAAGQFQVPAHSVPIGIVGTGSNHVGPCLSYQAIVGQGASSDPVCGTLADLGMTGVRGSMTAATAFAGQWNVFNGDGSAVATGATTTGGLQEFLTSCFKADAVAGVGYDCFWLGGQQTTAGGGGARIISPAVTVAIPAGSGKVLRAGATSLFSAAGIGSSPSLLVDSQIMGDIRLDGWQIFNFGTGPAIKFAPTTSILTGARAILDTRFSITTTGAILFDPTGSQGFTASEFNVIELNADQAKTSTVTVTIAAPGVFTWNSHGLLANTPIVFSTTGALPTGLTAATTYYVIAAGLSTNSFEVSASLGGSAINTSGSQSGTHTATASQTFLYGLKMMSPQSASGSNVQFHTVNIQHLHKIGPTGTALQWGDSSPTGLFQANTLRANISTEMPNANGIDTYASYDLGFFQIAGITSGVPVRFRSGANYNLYLVGYNSAPGNNIDAGTGNTILTGGSLSIGQNNGASYIDAAINVGLVTATGAIAAHLASPTGAFTQWEDVGGATWAAGVAHSASTWSLWQSRTSASAGTQRLSVSATEVNMSGASPIYSLTDTGASGRTWRMITSGGPFAIVDQTAVLNRLVLSTGGALSLPAYTAGVLQTDGSGNVTASTVAIGSISGLGIGVATALGVNVGTAGAPVVNGGALGSPSSAGTLPAHALGGTVSGGGNQINNVVIGASTPLAGSFTSLAVSSAVAGVYNPMSLRNTSNNSGAYNLIGVGNDGSTTTLQFGVTSTTNNGSGYGSGSDAVFLAGAGNINFISATNDVYLKTQTSGKNLFVYTGAQVLALTIDGSQNATFAAGNIVMGAAAKTLVLKQGANGAVGQFTCVSASNVTVNNSFIAAGDTVIVFYESGTAAAPSPVGNAKTNGTSFRVACASGDTALYNYAILKNAAWLIKRDLRPDNDNHPASRAAA